MENIELIITVRKVQGTHEQIVYYARVPARSIRRGRRANFGRRISRKLYNLIDSNAADGRVDAMPELLKVGLCVESSWRVSVPLEVVENVKLF